MDGDTLALQPAWQASLSDVSVQLFKGGVVQVLSLAKMYIGVQGRVGSVLSLATRQRHSLSGVDKSFPTIPRRFLVASYLMPFICIFPVVCNVGPIVQPVHLQPSFPGEPSNAFLLTFHM